MSCVIASHSGSATAAVFSRQAKRPARGFEKPVALLLRAAHPVFFRRRKGEPQQIRRSSNQTAAHAHAKKGALEEAWGRITGGRQPLASLFRESRSYYIRLHQCLNIFRQFRPEQI